MKKQKTIVSLALAGCMSMSVMACSSEKETKEDASEKTSTEQASTEEKVDSEETTEKETGGDFSEQVKFSATFFDADNSWKDNDMYKLVADKFNIDMDFVAISWSDWGEKQRIWVNSGDMPDVLFWDFNYSDYLNFSDQELIRALPEGWEEKYPNLYDIVKQSGIYDYLMEIGDGKLYGFPRTTFFSTRTTSFSSGEEGADHYAYVYRKDWAEKLGIEVPDVITFDEMLDLAKTFITQDPGENGAGKTIGIAGDPVGISKIFVDNYNSYCSTFGKNEDGSYFAGIMQDSTLDGVKAMYEAYQDGLIDPNFFSNKPETAVDEFNAGLAGIYIDNLTTPNVQTTLNKFQEQNPDLNAEDCVGICVVTGADGKVHGYTQDNWWSFALFNPDIDDETMDRILTIMDYFCTEEGIKLANFGIEGVDYTVENGKIIGIEETDDEGNPITIDSKYPCSKLFNYIACCTQNSDVVIENSPTLSEYAATIGSNIPKLKSEAGLNISEMDTNKKFCTGEAYKSYDVFYYTLATDVVLSAKSEEDVETLWAEKMSEIEDKTNKAIADLNAAANN